MFGLNQALIRILLQEELEVGLLVDELPSKEVAESLEICVSQALVEKLGLLLLELALLEAFAISLVGSAGVLGSLITGLEEVHDVLLLGLSLGLILLFHVTSPLCSTSCLQLLVLPSLSSLFQELSSSSQLSLLLCLLNRQQGLDIRALLPQLLQQGRSLHGCVNVLRDAVYAIFLLFSLSFPLPLVEQAGLLERLDPGLLSLLSLQEVTSVKLLVECHLLLLELIVGSSVLLFKLLLSGLEGHSPRLLGSLKFRDCFGISSTNDVDEVTFQLFRGLGSLCMPPAHFFSSLLDLLLPSLLSLALKSFELTLLLQPHFVGTLF